MLTPWLVLGSLNDFEEEFAPLFESPEDFGENFNSNTKICGNFDIAKSIFRRSSPNKSSLFATSSRITSEGTFLW
jgi:hypothetical protein